MDITTEQIEAWKEKYGDIFSITPIDGIRIIYKPLDRGGYMNIMSQQMEGIIGDPELETVKLCVLNELPSDIFATRGGLATVIYEEIMKTSGFTVVESVQL